MSNTSSRDLGPAERAVYDLVRSGVLNVAHTPLYRRQLAALVKASLIARDDDGRYIDAATPGAAPPPRARPPSTPPPRPPMATLVARVPKDVLDAIDALGAECHCTRSEALRQLLGAKTAAN